jgi:hypothetical protein
MINQNEKLGDEKQKYVELLDKTISNISEEDYFSNEDLCTKGKTLLPQNPGLAK